MPSMANITVKKNDGSTDVTYSALAGSSGQDVAALWRNESFVAPAAFRPSLRVVARGAQDSGTRTVEALAVFPITQDNSGTKVQVGVHTVRTISKIVITDAQANVDEAVSQGVNLAASALIRSAMKEGFAPRG